MGRSRIPPLLFFVMIEIGLFRHSVHTFRTGMRASPDPHVALPYGTRTWLRAHVSFCPLRAA
jgi:hypothetical protein